MRRRRYLRVRKVLVWGFLFVASTLAGAIAFAYSYITDSETLASLIREESPRYFPSSRVEVLRVQLRPFVGEVDVKHATIYQTIDGAQVPTLRIPWLQVRSDFRSVLRGKLAMREVAVAQPRLRLARRKDGTWNLQGLLADPFPQTNMPKPVVVVNGGIVELADGTEVLSKVWMRIEPQTDGSYKFEGSGRGTAFDRMALAGTFHPKTGRLVLSGGELDGLSISDSLRALVPEPWRASLDRLGLERGVVDVAVARLVRDPKATPPLDYELGVTLRDGVWKCPQMPFPLAEVSASIGITPTTIRVEHADGHDGKTTVRLAGATLSASDPTEGPMDATIRVENLELDERLRRATPPKFARLWEEYAPPGRPGTPTRPTRWATWATAPGSRAATSPCRRSTAPRTSAPRCSRR